MAMEFAFNSKLFAFPVRHSGRAAQQVIRVRGSFTSKVSNATLSTALLDTSGAGRSWSESELRLNNASDDDLVVVVGYIVLDPEEEWQRLLPPDNFMPKDNIEKFDPEKHPILDPSKVKVGIVVARIKAETYVSLFVLVRKSADGLCGVMSMPRGQVEDRLRVFFFKEWAAEGHVQHRARYQAWKGSIRQFVKEWRQKSSSRSPQNSIERAPDHEELSVLDISELNSTIQNIICGTEAASADEAEAAALACNMLWFGNSQGTTHLAISGAHLEALARAIRSGALNDERVPEQLHRALVVDFCMEMNRHAPTLGPRPVVRRTAARVEDDDLELFNMGEEAAPAETETDEWDRKVAGIANNCLIRARLLVQ